MTEWQKKIKKITATRSLFCHTSYQLQIYWVHHLLQTPNFIQMDFVWMDLRDLYKCDFELKIRMQERVLAGLFGASHHEASFGLWTFLNWFFIFLFLSQWRLANKVFCGFESLNYCRYDVSSRNCDRQYIVKIYGKKYSCWIRWNKLTLVIERIYFSDKSCVQFFILFWSGNILSYAWCWHISEFIYFRIIFKRCVTVLRKTTTSIFCFNDMKPKLFDFQNLNWW